MALDGLTGPTLRPCPLQRVIGPQGSLLPWLQAQVPSSGSPSSPSSWEHFSSGPALGGAFDKILRIFRADVYMLGQTQSLCKFQQHSSPRGSFQRLKLSGAPEPGHSPAVRGQAAPDGGAEVAGSYKTHRRPG